MKNKIFFAVILCFQVLLSQRLSHPLRADAEIPRVSISSSSFPDTLNVLAILVQFQQDNDSRTSGNGFFDLTGSNERIVDAPPHDSAYIADHFIFAQNYFSKASNGKQNVRTVVLGSVITLKKQMKDYAPVNGNLPLAHMIEESWKAADSLYPGFPFQQYDMFALIHAGVGRDIDLRAALGFDPTPLDIPSLYFSLNSFKSVFEDPGYQGISLVNSSFKISNTVVLPETEVRRIPSVGGDFVLKLGINGLLVASIGSHLGLPDLFDTKTGKSGIGRFGLMDGQSIFSFSGICPPEPSAWEKIYLGWTTPIEIYGNQTVNVPAVGLYPTGNDTIYKIPISAKEYFLVENRQRDTKDDGQIVTIKWNGSTFAKTFLRDENSFSSTNIDSVYGVVLDVDELDWSLPGLINANNNYKGGILVWHIDETIIGKNLGTNSVNAEPDKRGVDLEEADGSQDIGQSYDFGDPASGSEDGWALDYWFSGNDFPNYKNEFSENTNPNSLSNTFAKSHIILKNFSGQSPRMTFEANVGDANIQLVKVIKRHNLKLDNNDAPIAADLNGDGKEELIFTSGDSIYVLKNNLSSFLSDTTGLFSPFGGKFQPTTLTFVENPAGKNIVGVKNSQMSVFQNTDVNLDGIGDTLFLYNSSASITTPLSTLRVNTGTPIAASHIKFGNLDGKLFDIRQFSTGNWLMDSTQEFHQSIVGLSTVTNDLVYSTDSLKRIIPITDFGGRTIKALTMDENLFVYVLLNDNTITSFNFFSPSNIRYFNTNQNATSSFAVADVNSDGRLDILVGTNTGLFAYNTNGVPIENFPLKTLDGGAVVGSPILVKLTGSNETAIVFGSTNGQLYAYTSKAKLINGFPLQTGGMVSSPVLWGDKLVAASSDTSIYVWKTGNLFDTSRVLWGNFLADNYHSNFAKKAGSIIQKSSELLPKKFAYNWPNPVYSGSTNIRYFLGKSATVKIKIVNLAGELVDEIQGTNYAGLDNEVQWNVTNIQSGIYFAQITASGSGEEASQIVKIAVVK